MNNLVHMKQFLGRRIKSLEKAGKRWYQYHLYLYHRIYLTQDTPILIFTSGKVGSTSVYESLPQDIFWIQSHTINPEKIHEIQQKYVDEGMVRNSPHHHHSLQFLQHVVQKGKPAKYITLFRDPIARNLSAYFQVKLRLNQFDVHNPVNMAELTQNFLEEYPHDVILDWFDDEYKKMLGIDIYQYPFDIDQGYLQVDAENANILIMRTELADMIKEQIISEFLGLPDYKLKKSNVSSDKDFGNIYKQIKSEIILPKDYIDRMISSKYMQHFFSDTERQNIQEKWFKRLE